MALDPSIILSGQQFDLMGAINAGRESAMQQKAFDQQNALAELYRTQGAGMASGNPASLNALAQFDPAAAQSLAYSAEDQQRKREEARALAEEGLRAQAATLTAEQLAAEQKALSDVLTGGAFFYQNKDQAGYDSFLKSKGVDPAEYPFQAFPAHAASVEGVLDAMKAFAPPEPPKPADDYGRYVQEETAKGAVPLSRIEFANAMKGNGVTQTIRNPDGSETTIQIGGPAGGAGGLDLTEAEGKATGFLYRMDESNKTLTDLEAEGTSLWNKGSKAIPFNLGNYLVGPKAQNFDQAKRDFINAILRRESGAVISPEEFANAEVQYFPQPGDGPEVIAQKRKNRLIAIEGVRASSGAGGATTSGVDSGSPPPTGAFDPAEIDQLMLGP